ncbi:hypothetical protein C8R47DRAFT_459034 [Mycena vitilis]|nr:hypothetical protein C8R47DRAFT_459034 [Mycena vitilis]
MAARCMHHDRLRYRRCRRWCAERPTPCDLAVAAFLSIVSATPMVLLCPPVLARFMATLRPIRCPLFLAPICASRCCRLRPSYPDSSKAGLIRRCTWSCANNSVSHRLSMALGVMRIGRRQYSVPVRWMPSFLGSPISLPPQVTRATLTIQHRDRASSASSIVLRGRAKTASLLSSAAVLE